MTGTNSGWDRSIGLASHTASPPSATLHERASMGRAPARPSFEGGPAGAGRRRWPSPATARTARPPPPAAPTTEEHQDPDEHGRQQVHEATTVIHATSRHSSTPLLDPRRCPIARPVAHGAQRSELPPGRYRSHHYAHIRPGGLVVAVIAVAGCQSGPVQPVPSPSRDAGVPTATPMPPASPEPSVTPRPSQPAPTAQPPAPTAKPAPRHVEAQASQADIQRRREVPAGRHPARREGLRARPRWVAIP